MTYRAVSPHSFIFLLFPVAYPEEYITSILIIFVKRYQKCKIMYQFGSFKPDQFPIAFY